VLCQLSQNTVRY